MKNISAADPVLATSTSEFSRQAIIERECLALLYNQAPTVLFAIIATISYVAVCLYGHVPTGQLATWYCAYTLLVVARFFLCSAFAKHRSKLADPIWRLLAIGSSTLSGTMIGMIYIFFLVTDPPYLMVVSIIIGIAMAANSVASLSSVPAAYLGFCLPCMVLMIAGVLVEPNYSILALNGVICLVAFILFSLSHHRMIVQSITLRLDNAELVENLREQKAVAEQANTDKSRFLAAASHDLRQPMHAIGLLVEAMEHRLQGQQADLFCTLNKSVHNLKDLFDALLDISRLDAGVVDVSKHHFSLTELINELIPGYKQRAKLKDLDFNIEQPADSVVFSDPILLRRILENLISNAIRYTDSGEISIRINHQGGNVLLSIKDTGRGISSEDQSKVFTEFFQVDNPERDRTKGLGLGLSIVHRLAVLLEIKLELSSTLAAGTCFRFFLPAGQEDKIFVSTAASPAHLPEVEATILIIDDEQDVLVAMQAMLTGWGYKIYTAEDLDGALSVLNKLPTTVDLVISDYRLREHKTGSEVISALRTHVGKTIPALIITGDTEAARIQKAQSSGIQLLHKPVRPAQLRLAILHCIGNRHLNTIQD